MRHLLLPEGLASLALPAQTTVGGVELAGLDLVGLGIVGVLVVLGIARGLWWQLMRLAGLVAAVVLARTFAPRGAEWIAGLWPEIQPRLAHGASWMLIFLGGLAVAALLGMIGHRLLEAMQLGLANRMGGGVLGAATGLLLHVALVMALCQLAPRGFVERRVAGTYSERLYRSASARWEDLVGRELLDPVAAAEVHGLLSSDAARGAAGGSSAAPAGSPEGAPAGVR